MDYQGNSKKAKTPNDPEKEEKPSKSIEKVVVGEVIVKKKSIGQKLKSIFVEADFRSVTRYVISDVLIPAARNMIVDASTKGVERMMYGERAQQRRGYSGGPRVTYNSPINRTEYRSSVTRPPSQMGPSNPRAGRNDFILATREEASLVLERMNDILEMYEVVSVADLNELVGFPTSYVDQKWGWVFLGDTHIRQVREGFMIDLPPAESI